MRGREIQSEGGCIDGDEGGGAEGAVDNAGYEAVTRRAAKHGEQVLRAWIGERQTTGDFGGSEKY